MITVHHAYGKESNSKSVYKEIRGPLMLEATRIFLKYRKRSQLYKELKEKGKIYLSRRSHTIFHRTYKEFCLISPEETRSEYKTNPKKVSKKLKKHFSEQ